MVEQLKESYVLVNRPLKERESQGTRLTSSQRQKGPRFTASKPTAGWE